MIEIKIDDVGDINIQRMWGKSKCTVELTKEQAKTILRDLLFEENLVNSLYLDEVQELHKIASVILAKNEELEAV